MHLFRTGHSPRGRSKLFLKYEDGVAGVVELAGKGVFTAWLQNGVFEQVRLSEAGHPEWPGEIDLCPDKLYLRLTGKRPEELMNVFRRASAMEAPKKIAPLA